jgi:hypothetical protein
MSLLIGVKFSDSTNFDPGFYPLSFSDIYSEWLSDSERIKSQNNEWFSRIDIRSDSDE